MVTMLAKVPVTMRALVQRINRRLAKEQKVLKKARGCAVTQEFGPYYLLNWSSHTVEQMQVEPGELATARNQIIFMAAV